MNSTCKSGIPDNMKIHFFRATIEPVIIYCSVSWTLTKAREKRPNGNYT